MLETTLSWWSVPLSVLLLSLITAVVALTLLRILLLLAVALLAVALLGWCVSLARCGRTVLLLAVLLAVLIVWVGHVDGIDLCVVVVEGDCRDDVVEVAGDEGRWRGKP